MKQPFINLIVAVCVSLLITRGYAEDWPEMTFPADATIEIVADEIIFNGVKMKLWQIQSKKPPEQILVHYRTEWAGLPRISKQAPAYTEYPMADWKVISRAYDEYQTTVQVQSSGKKGSLALVGISKIFDRDGVQWRPSFPLPDGSTLINEIKSKDNGRNSRTIVAENNLPVKSNYHYYKRKYSGEKWVSIGTDTQGRDYGTLVMMKGKAELNMTFSRFGGKTQVVGVLID